MSDHDRTDRDLDADAVGRRRERLVVVGNGMVALRFLEELTRLAPGRYRITVFGAEPGPAYNRIRLSAVLAGDDTPRSIRLVDEAWYAARGCVLRAASAVTRIDRQRRRVQSSDGRWTPYDRLVLVTGSEAIRLDLPGAGLAGVVTFRALGDVEQMLERSRPGAPAVVVGGGLLGLEAASGLARRGMAVTVVHLLETPMERQLDAEGGALLRASLEAQGLRFVMPAQASAVLGNGAVTALRLADGRELPARLVVMAVGIRPNAALAREAGLVCAAGVRVDDALRTSDPRIHALGECAEHRGRTYGLVPPLYEQAAVCARVLAGCEDAAYPGSLEATSLKVSGVRIYAAGAPQLPSGSQSLVYRDPGAGVYKRLAVHDGRLIGAVLCGETGDGPWYADLIREGQAVEPMREALLFGQAQVRAQVQMQRAQQDNGTAG